MPNRCKEIRKIVQDALICKNEFENRVHNNIYNPLYLEKHTPAISIITPKEKSDNITNSGKIFERETDLIIILCTKQSHNSEGDRDDIMAIIESIINNINHPDFTFKYIGFDTEANIESLYSFLITTINYTCTYNTNEINNIIGNNFNTLSIEVTNA